MPYHDYFILMGIGGAFLIIGISLVARGTRVEKIYSDSLSTHTDVKKYLQSRPHPQFESLKMGGWIAIAVGLTMIAVGGALWLWS